MFSFSTLLGRVIDVDAWSQLSPPVRQSSKTAERPKLKSLGAIDYAFSYRNLQPNLLSLICHRVVLTHSLLCLGMCLARP